MAARPARLDPLVRQLEVWRDEAASPRARSAALASAAKAEIARAHAINRSAMGGEPHFEVFVDGRRSAPIDAVAPGGTVFAEWSFLSPALLFIRESLQKASPVRTGRYRESHLLIVDGEEVAIDGDLPDVFEEAHFINAQPYARKIERGLSNQAPEGVFQVVAALAHRRFGNLVRVSYAWRGLFGSSALDRWAASTTLQKEGRRTMGNAERADWLRRQPTIIVEAL